MFLVERQSPAHPVNSPSLGFMAGYRSEARYDDLTDSEIEQLAAEMDLAAKIDLGFYEHEPLAAPDVDEGDGPEGLTLGDYWPSPEDPEAL